MIADTANSDGIIWVSKIDDPRMFGVVKLDGDGTITDFVEKPVEFVSDLAIIGIYYIKDGDNFRNELQYLVFSCFLEVLAANNRVLEIKKGAAVNQTESKNITDSIIVEPCFIGKDVKINRSVIGPHVSIGSNTVINDSVITNSIIQSNTSVISKVIDNSMIGNYAILDGKPEEYSMGDFTTEK